MNWGLEKIFFYILVFILIIILIVYSVNNYLGFIEKTNTEEEIIVENNIIDTYEKLENSVEMATKKYIIKNYPQLSIKDNFIIMTDSLIKGKYIENIKDIKNKSLNCNGYVTVYNNGKNINYKVYIKCGNKYTTNGYDNKYMEKF